MNVSLGPAVTGGSFFYAMNFILKKLGWRGGIDRQFRIKSRQRVRRVQNDPRFFKFLCELYPNAIITPVALVTAFPTLISKANFHSFDGWESAIKIGTVAMTLFVAGLELPLKRSRYFRFLKASGISKRADPIRYSVVECRSTKSGI